MEAQEVHIKAPNKFKTYIVFTKFRLSFLVVLSALSGYLFADGTDLLVITELLIGGMLVTAASNGSNQIWERHLDKLMHRTHRRPIPMGHMTVREGLIVVIVCLVVGTFLLYRINIEANPNCSSKHIENRAQTKPCQIYTYFVLRYSIEFSREMRKDTSIRERFNKERPKRKQQNVEEKI